MESRRCEETSSKSDCPTDERGQDYLDTEGERDETLQNHCGVYSERDETLQNHWDAEGVGDMGASTTTGHVIYFGIQD